MIQNEKKNLYRPLLAVTLAVLGWGLSTTFVDFGLDFITPLPFLTLRFLLATLIVTPLIIPRWRKAVILFKNRGIWLIAIFEAAGLIFQYLGQQTVPAALSSLLTMLNILLVPFLAWRVLGEKILGLNILAIILALLGVILIVGFPSPTAVSSDASFIGVIFLLCSAASYALYQVATIRVTTREEIDTPILFFVVMALISLLSFLSSLVITNFDFNAFSNFQPEAWVWISLLAIFSTVIAFMGHFESSKSIPANVLAVFLTSQFIVPLIIDLFLGVPYNFWTLSGGGVIIVAIGVVLIIPFQRKNGKNREPDVTEEHLSERILV